MVTPTGALHGQVSGTIYFLLRLHAGQVGAGLVSAAETGYLIARDPDTVRAPDVAFVCAERVPPGGPPRGYWPYAPDLAVEVVSPSDRWTEVESKARMWLAAGSKLVWVVDPDGKIIHVHRADGSVLQLTTADTLTGGPVLPDFTVRVADLFALSKG